MSKENLEIFQYLESIKSKIKSIEIHSMEETPGKSRPEYFTLDAFDCTFLKDGIVLKGSGLLYVFPFSNIKYVLASIKD